MFILEKNSISKIKAITENYSRKPRLEFVVENGCGPCTGTCQGSCSGDCAGTCSEQKN